ncbi:hypothetical protein HDU96_003561 [Phlyctochytrium bullatum]|nr:hypothetical protein HDU96_003561 [Phlyctochytrium bullatum]
MVVVTSSSSHHDRHTETPVNRVGRAVAVQLVAVAHGLVMVAPGALLTWGFVEVMNSLAGKSLGGFYFDPAATAVVPYTYTLAVGATGVAMLCARGQYGLLLIFFTTCLLLVAFTLVLLLVLHVALTYARVIMISLMVVVFSLFYLLVVRFFPEMAVPEYVPPCFSKDKNVKYPKIKLIEYIKFVMLAVSAVVVGYSGLIGTQFSGNWVLRLVCDILAGLLQIFVFDALANIPNDVYWRMGYVTQDDFELIQKMITITSCQANVKIMRFLNLYSGLKSESDRAAYWGYAVICIVTERVLPRISSLLARIMVRRQLRQVEAAVTPKPPDVSEPPQIVTTRSAATLPPPLPRPSTGGTRPRHPRFSTPSLAPPTTMFLSARTADPKTIVNAVVYETTASHHNLVNGDVNSVSTASLVAPGALPSNLLQTALAKLEDYYCVRRNDHALASYVSTLYALNAVWFVGRSRMLKERTEGFDAWELVVVAAAYVGMSFVLEAGLVLVEASRGVPVGCPQKVHAFCIMCMACLTPCLFFTCYAGTHCIYGLVPDGNGFAPCV